MMRIRIAALLGVLALTLSACGGANTKAADASGDWGVDQRGEPNLHLAKDGKVSGSDGCNRLLSTWKQDGDQVKFTVVAGTLMACEGVDTWLSAMQGATIDGDLLIIKGPDGKKIGELKRRATD